MGYYVNPSAALAPYIGFTEEEVRGLCAEYGLDFQETQKWYDGYRLDYDQHVYCPNSIMELISRRKFDSYWTKTETYTQRASRNACPCGTGGLRPTKYRLYDS